MNVNRAIRKAIGIDASQLFREWKDDLKKQYSEKMKATVTKSAEQTKKVLHLKDGEIVLMESLSLRIAVSVTAILSEKKKLVFMRVFRDYEIYFS
ncbi:MAG: hypothetical protein ACOYWZ_01160 [Bacillota bacterium]